MTAALTWSHKIDGVELNDFTDYLTKVPEAMSDPGVAALLTDMQARTPVFNRQQPLPGKFTFLTYVLFDSEPDYQTLLATLKSLYGPGAHTYQCQAPGESASRSVVVYFDGGPSVDLSGVGAVTARAIAPDPTWT